MRILRKSGTDRVVDALRTAIVEGGSLDVVSSALSLGGAVTVYRGPFKKVSERGVTADAVNRFLEGLHQVDALFPALVNADGQIQGFKAADRNASL